MTGTHAQIEHVPAGERALILEQGGGLGAGQSPGRIVAIDTAGVINAPIHFILSRNRHRSPQGLEVL
jgi:hypothetical protein